MRISGTRSGHSGPSGVVVAVVVTMVVTVLAVAAGVVARGGGEASAAAGTSAAASAAAGADARLPAVAGAGAEVRALAVLHRWDRARARAWARGDPAALARLYAPRSRAGQRDVAMLRAWLRRGLRVEGLRMQVLDAALVVRDRRRLVVMVTDRVAGGLAVGRADPSPRAGRRALPRDLPRDLASTRRLVFLRVAGRWLLSSVQPRASPVASTASTSGSANS
ncbi:hypothetical protein F9L07_03790 [Pimelobacter simplex]|uniref:Uncharacterized protein n=1 Tax=Nocardioides simplex TaxID=2045 RepID=A0A7J5DYV6_NOCSI|nr:hypothetical protein [Pimelobacter simplex]KAB2811063.1 hypothetical protein F9L07_03790 [Pimelobacter simplex]